VNPRDTHRLTRASLELSSRDERRRRTVTLLVATGVLLLAGGGSLWLAADGAALAPGQADLATENESLRAEVERLRTEVGLERATRAELDREAGDLHARIDELTNRLEFLAARDPGPAGPR